MAKMLSINALIVAARADLVRFVAGAAIAVLATIVAQWQLEEFLWWSLQVVGVTALLFVAARPDPTPVTSEPARPAVQERKGPSKTQAKKAQRKSQRSDRKRTARR